MSESLPLSTFLIGGAAVAVLGFAGYMALGSKPAKTEAAPEVAPSVSGPAKKSVLPESPLSVKREMHDALERAKLWKPLAKLVSIEGGIEDGKVLPGIRFEFAEPTARLLGAVGRERFAVTYEGGEATPSYPSPRGTQVALPEPNCPLESAFPTVRNQPSLSKGKIVFSYGYSTKHGRTLWTFASVTGDPVRVDGDGCQLLLR